MTAYMIALVDVTDPDAYQEYAKRTPAVVEKYGGRFVVRGGRQVALEGDPGPARTVIIEFPTLERVEEFFNSPEYREAKAFRQGAATARFLAVEGV